MMKSTFIAIISVMIVILCGCKVTKSSQKISSQIALYLSPEYRVRVDSLSLGMKDIARLLHSHLVATGYTREDIDRMVVRHWVLVEDEYLITMSEPRSDKLEKPCMPLWGYYINGRTGQIRFVSQTAAGEPGIMGEELKKFLGGGDRLVSSPEWWDAWREEKAHGSARSHP